MSLDFPTLCFPITMNWGMGKLKLSTCPLAGFCWTLFLPINLSMFAFYTTLKQEERSWQLWIKKLINMLTVKFQLAGLPCHPVLLWLHISSSTNAFSFRSTTIRSSRVHHGFTTTSEKKQLEVGIGFTWVLPGLPGLPLIAKLVPVLDSAASSPSGETARKFSAVWKTSSYPSWWKWWNEPTQKIKTHRDQIFMKTDKII